MDVSEKSVPLLNQFLLTPYAQGGTHFQSCVKIICTLFALSLKEAELRKCSCRYLCGNLQFSLSVADSVNSVKRDCTMFLANYTPTRQSSEYPV